jgi:hypothetical protein
VEITYVNELKADIEGEGVLVTLPTSIAPRYGAPPPHLSASSATDKNGLQITIHVNTSEPLRKLESRTHPISVEMGTAGTVGLLAAVSSFGDLAGADEKLDNGFDPKKAKATLSERHVTLGRDFVLLILASGSKMLASGALLEESLGAEAQSAMKLTLNPRDLFSSYIEPEAFNGEIIFIADRSGSMHGPKMDTLKDALNVFLKSLTEEAHFNIYSFGSRFTSLWPQSQPYTDHNIELAVRNISTFTANMGGTEILQPIREAVQKRIIKKNFTTQIICLTDGEVWKETLVRNFVRATRSELKDAVRFFALGIGNGVSHRLIEGIGTEGGGFAEVVAVDNRGRWEGRVMRLVKGALMPNSYNCEIEFSGMSTQTTCFSTVGSSFMQAPSRVPALHPFSKTTVYFLFDKGYGTDLNVVTLKTSTPSGKQISVEIPVSKSTANTYTVHHLAAKAIVTDLETGKSWLHDTMSNDNAADTAAKELGEQLAINYHITSKWTSFVAVEKKRKEENVGWLYKASRGDLATLNKSRMAPIAPIQQVPGSVSWVGEFYSATLPLGNTSQLLGADRFPTNFSPLYTNQEFPGYSIQCRRRSPDRTVYFSDTSPTHETSSSEIPRLTPSLGDTNAMRVEEATSGANSVKVKEPASIYMKSRNAEPSSPKGCKIREEVISVLTKSKKIKNDDESPQQAGVAGNEAPESANDLQDLDVVFGSIQRIENPQTDIPIDVAYELNKYSSTDEAQPKTLIPMDTLVGAPSKHHSPLSTNEAIQGLPSLASFRAMKTRESDESPQHTAIVQSEPPRCAFDPQKPATFKRIQSQATPRLPNLQTTVPTNAAYTLENISSTIETQQKAQMDALLHRLKGSMALDLHNLIRVQSANGSFKLPQNFTQTLCSHFNADILTRLEDILAGSGEDMKAKFDDTIGLLLQTLIAVMWIKLVCAEDKETWELLVSKAERWIGKTVGNKEVEERLWECAKVQWVMPNHKGLTAKQMQSG